MSILICLNLKYNIKKNFDKSSNPFKLPSVVTVIELHRLELQYD